MLDAKQPFLEQLLAGQKTKISIESLEDDYCEAIICQDPKGPYLLAGIFFGGLLAFEYAKVLQQKGKEVTAVVMQTLCSRPE